MAEYETRHWEPRFEGATRKDRAGCSYEVYLPDELSGWDLTLPADLAADVADAEAAIRDLNAEGTTHVSLEGLARFLLRAESVASSRIEGIEASPQRLLRAESAIAQGGDAADRAAAEILANIAAMQSAIDLAANPKRIDLPDLLRIHDRLLAQSDVGTPGVVRSQQNWIGGSSYNPCAAEFVPPPHTQLTPLLKDLVSYLNEDWHSPLVQAAVAHAQFETIHPFDDGNGRAGRALIHVVLRRRNLATRFVPPISLVLATWSDDYLSGLTAFRHTSAPDSRERSEAAYTWLRTFAAATLRACSDAQRYAADIEALDHRWRTTLGKVRRDSTVDRLIKVLPGVPMVTTKSVAALTSRSEVSSSAAIAKLVEGGILVQRNIGRQRYRVFEAGDVVGLFTSLERALASPSGETEIDPPVRPAPVRPGRRR